MNFLNLDDIRELVFSLRKLSIEESSSDRYLAPNQYELITLDMFRIHLDAGKENFSLPRSGLYSSLAEYSHLQVMIEEQLKSTTNLAFICPAEDPRFQKFKWVKYFSHDYKVYSRAKDRSYIGKEVPFEETLQLIKDCHKISGLKMFF